MASNRSATAVAARVISTALDRHGFLDGRAPIVLAVSGGQDSLGLLMAAVALPRRHRLPLVVAHFSHGLRPSADPKATALVKRLASSLGIEFIHGEGNTGPSEAAAREARYAFLANAAQSASASAVLTAHTEDDQAETLLLRLARGTGTRGAGAIKELSTRNVQDYELVLLRPLLRISRRDTAQVCAEAAVTPIVDGSNRSLRYARNRVRGRVLPELERLNPKAKSALAEFAGAMQSDEQLLAYLAAQAVVNVERRSDGNVAWPSQALASLESPLLVRVLQSAWEYMAGDGAVLSSRRFQAVQHLVAGPGGQLDLGHGLCFFIEQDIAYLGRSSGGFRPLR